MLPRISALYFVIQLISSSRVFVVDLTMYILIVVLASAIHTSTSLSSPTIPCFWPSMVTMSLRLVGIHLNLQPSLVFCLDPIFWRLVPFDHHTALIVQT